MPRAITPTAPKMAHRLREVSELTSIGYDRLRGYIESGQLRAKRERNAEGEPIGPYRVLAKDLDAFLDSLPDA